MRASKPGKSIYMELGFWYNDVDGHIHLTAKDVEGFHTTVNNDPGSKRCHENLYLKLAKCLKDAGAPHPEMVSKDDA